MVAALVGEITRDPIVLCEGFVNSGEGCGKLLQGIDFEPVNRVLEEKRAIMPGAADRAALEENGARCVSDQVPCGDDRL